MPVLKPTKFGGFDRQSVLDYIYETINSNQDAQDRLHAQIDEMNATRENLERSVKDLEDRLLAKDRARDSLVEELDAAKGKNNELSSMLQTLNDEIDRQKALVLEKDNELRHMTDAKGNLERETADLQQQAMHLQQGQAEIEKSKHRIGELLVKSHLDAELVLTQTNTKAQQTIDQANTKAQQTIQEANLRAKQVEDEAGKSAAELTEQLGEFRSEVCSLEEKLEESIVAVREKFASIIDFVNQKETNIKGLSRSGHIVLAPPPESETDDSISEQVSDFF